MTETLMMVFDPSAIKKKTWYRIYCGNLDTNINKIKKDEALLTFATNEFLRIKKEVEDAVTKR